MFLRILKLLIRTRFTPYYFVGLLFIFIYSMMAQVSQEGPERAFAGTLYVTLVLSLFGGISIVLGGLLSSKSDSEFLFVSAVERKDLGPALFLSQFLTTGPLIIAGSFYYILSMGATGLLEIVRFIDLIFMALLTVSLGITFSVLRTYQRVILAVVYVLWITSSLLGFSLGGVSFLGTDPWLPTVLVVAVAIISVVGCIISLSGEHLPVRVSSLRTGSRDFKKITGFTGISPFRTVLRFGITQISIASRASSMGGVRFAARRIRPIYFVVAMCAAAAFYVIIVVKFPMANQTGFNVPLFLFAFYLGIFPQIMISSGTIAMERAWLAFMSMEPWRYVRYLILAKMAQALLISLPMVIGSVIIWISGIPLGIYAAIGFLFVPPPVVSVFLFLSFSYKPYQVRDEEFIATRFGGSQYMIVVPIFVYTFAIAFILSFPPSTPFILGICYLGALFVLTRRRYWNDRLNNIVESGFI